MIAKIFTTILLFWYINSSFCIPHNWENTFLNPDYNEHGKMMDSKMSAMSAQPFCKDCVNAMAYDSSSASLNDDDVMLTNEITKRMHKDDSGESIFAKHRKLTFHHQQPKLCSCNHEKRLVDLGSDYFPRYISDMVCLPGGCGINYECRPKRFKIWVMRRRQEDEEPGAEPIPKDLREFWTGESIVTTIDCECSA